MGGCRGAALASLDMRARADRVALLTERLDNLLAAADAPMEIDYLSIDVEGSELEVLQGFPFDKHFAHVITIEHNQDEMRRHAVIALLKSNGYTFLGQLRWDDVFVYKLTIR